ncbi:MAG: phosphoribosyltransferase domain-containing protein [Lachnospiraceae bacterium]|nr:phosphoribosyltransferase domain-containing protein [Lachnospiraceae bacterium]
MNYKENDLITIAKRENNSKRSFLLVNPLQGKHIPAVPSQCLELFSTLAKQVFSEQKFDYKHTLIIGFAETATAIGMGLAACAPFPAAYIQTTREHFEGKEFLYFSEEHSHATDQMVIREFLDEHLTKDSHIIFAEDEVTTGKTIENFIRVLTKTYPDYHFSFSIASILNGMGEEKRNELQNQGIAIHFLLPVPTFDYEKILSEYSYENALRLRCAELTSCSSSSLTGRESISLPDATIYPGNYQNTRLGVMAPKYQELCQQLSVKIFKEVGLAEFSGKRVLVLGTEELMYAGIYLGNYIENHTNNHTFFHATTRSPILPSSEETYPLHKRYQLTSFYEQNRTTYLYNLDTYDLVLVLTDSTSNTTAMQELCQALALHHCNKIIHIIWR